MVEIQQVIYYSNPEFHGVKYSNPQNAALASLAKQFQDAIHAERIVDATDIHYKIQDILKGEYRVAYKMADNNFDDRR